MIKPVKIGDRYIGPGNPCFIIAEAGVNHNGCVKTAISLVDAAFDAGADAVKFQSFITDEIVSIRAPKAGYQVETTGAQKSQYDMLKALELNFEQHAKLKAYCDKLGLMYMCTPYDQKSAAMLNNLNVKAFKIASTDITNIPFLQYISIFNTPVLLSTGMSTLGEVELAYNTLKEHKLQNIIILHCTSEYPAPVDQSNLKAIITMQQAFQCPAGFSDHSKGLGVSPWAVAVGAAVIEKHFTLDREMQGPDHKASLEPDELSGLVSTIRDVEAALGDGIKRPMPSEISNKTYMQKSVVAKHNIPAGDVIKESDITCKRPGFGLSPSWFATIVGKKAAVDLTSGEILNLSSIDW